MHDMPQMMIVVKAAFDGEARVWFVESCEDLPGLNVEAATFEELQDKLSPAIIDLLEARSDDAGKLSFDVPVEIIAHAHQRVRQAAAA